MADSECYLKLYSQLIDMGFDENVSLMAAQNSQNINEAIEWMNNNKDIQNEQINDNENEYKYIDIDCDGNDISNCLPLTRIISLLQFYHNNYNNYKALTQYLMSDKSYLIGDYHHVLSEHLNEDNTTKQTSDSQFHFICKMIECNNLKCNIEKCAIYRRNNRERERRNIECNDNKLAVFVDIIDTIHCYFIHSVDSGYRIIHKLHQQNDDNSNESFAYDAEMKQLHDFIISKRNLLQSIRGERRIFNNKFMTHLSDDKFESNKVSEWKSVNDDSKDNDLKDNEPNEEQNAVFMEGYLQKRSLYLKKFRKRFIILKHNHLYCYTNHKKTQMTECIDLSLYKQAIISQKKVSQFELIPINNKVRVRVFSADSWDDMQEWISKINHSINPLEESCNLHQPPRKNVSLFSFGVRRDYWSKNNQCCRYKSIKDEVVSNKICSLEIFQFNNAYHKAEKLCNDSPYIKQLRCSKEAIHKFHLKNGSAVTSEHILSLILYTDYDSLSYRFSSTFRKILSNESNKYTTQRNSEFWNWSKTLIETVNAFGITLQDSKISVFYHGVSMIYFNSLIATINSPTSTTTKLEVAFQFATNDGIIIELGIAQLQRSKFERISYFNCSFISCHPNEDERLFIQPIDPQHHINLLSIRNMKTDENYKSFFQAIYILQSLTEKTVSKMIHDRYSLQITDAVKNIMNYMLNTPIEHNHFPDYVVRILQEWAKSVSQIWIDIEMIQKRVPWISIYEPIYNIIRIDTLNQFFRNVNTIVVYKRHGVESLETMEYWVRMAGMLDKINKFEFSNLKYIHIGSYETNINFAFYRKMCSLRKWTLSDKFNCVSMNWISLIPGEHELTDSWYEANGEALSMKVYDNFHDKVLTDIDNELQMFN